MSYTLCIMCKAFFNRQITANKHNSQNEGQRYKNIQQIPNFILPIFILFFKHKDINSNNYKPQCAIFLYFKSKDEYIS